MINDRNLRFGSRRESLKPGSISRLRASCQQPDSESDKEKQPPVVTLAGDYPINWFYVNLSQSTGYGWTPDRGKGFYITWLSLDLPRDGEFIEP